MATTTTTSQKIDKALEILKAQDWYWCMSDYTHPAYDYACGSMRAFVELVATINDNAIVKALRDLWTATYNYAHATMWGSNDKAKAEYEATKTALMAVIKPTAYAMAA
ncbi:MAG: hypothetical protein J6A02_11770 [Prevotella sp.]|nr:hypothetical protein [Prevotella sp.]